MYGGASGFTINLLSSSAISRNRVSKNGVMFPPFSYVFFFFLELQGVTRRMILFQFLFVEEKLVLCK